MLAQIHPNKIVDYFPVQSVLWTVGQRNTGNCLVQYWPSRIKTTLRSFFYCKKMTVRPWANIVQVIFLCYVFSDIFADILIPWQFPMQYYPSLIDATGLQTTMHWENPVQCYRNTPGTTLNRQKPYAMLSLRLQSTTYRVTGNIHLYCWPNTLETTLHKSKPYARGFRQHCTGKNPVQCRLNNIWSLFAKFYFEPVNFFNNQLLQMRGLHNSNFVDFAQEKSRTNIEQKKQGCTNNLMRDQIGSYAEIIDS